MANAFAFILHPSSFILPGNRAGLRRVHQLNTTKAPRMDRRPELDALRGLMLILMTVTHVPTVYSMWLSQPFGYVSAAEGFVFLSAYLVGAVYTRTAIEHGVEAMRARLWRRAGVVWLCQAGMLLFLFTMIAQVGLLTGRRSIKNLISFYLAEPVDALWTGLALIYNPPLLDILPMYVLLMLASPVALAIGLRRRGWTLVIAVSLTLWLLAQFGLSQASYNAIVRATGLRVPLHETGAFELVAWQFLWILGLWMGSRREAIPNRRGFPGWLVGFSLVFAAACLIWRHAVGQTPFEPHQLNLLFDKWRLGPLRLLDFFALLVIVARFGPYVAARWRFKMLEALGRASLPAFCAHLVIVLVVLSITGDRVGTAPLWLDTMVLGLALAGVYAVALVSNVFDREQRSTPAPVVNARTGG
jgi:hypothetical protein